MHKRTITTYLEEFSLIEKYLKFDTAELENAKEDDDKVLDYPLMCGVDIDFAYTTGLVDGSVYFHRPEPLTVVNFVNDGFTKDPWEILNEYAVDISRAMAGAGSPLNVIPISLDPEEKVKNREKKLFGFRHLSVCSFACSVYLDLSRLHPCYNTLVYLNLQGVRMDTTKFLLNMPRLEILMLKYCGLRCVPEEIEQLQHLTHVDLVGNCISFLPDCLLWKPRLVRLRLPDGLKSPLPLRLGAIEDVLRGSESNIWRFGTAELESMKWKWRLLEMIASGLVEADACKTTPWTQFLCKGLYDPRLFLFVWFLLFEE